MVDMSKAKSKNNLVLVSFKLSAEFFEQLKEYSKDQKDEAGIPLSPSQAARRLMLDALKRKKS